MSEGVGSHGLGCWPVERKSRSELMNSAIAARMSGPPAGRDRPRKVAMQGSPMMDEGPGENEAEKDERRRKPDARPPLRALYLRAHRRAEYHVSPGTLSRAESLVPDPHSHQHQLRSLTARRCPNQGCGGGEGSGSALSLRARTSSARSSSLRPGLKCSRGSRMSLFSK